MAKRNGKRKRRKRKLTAAEKAEKKKRRAEFMTIFVRGKMKRVPRPPTIDGMDVDEFIRRNADPIWLHQEGLWEYMYLTEVPEPLNLPDEPEPLESATCPEDFEDLDWPEEEGASKPEQPDDVWPPIIPPDDFDRDIPF